MLCCQFFHSDLHKQHDTTGAAYLIQGEEEGFAQRHDMQGLKKPMGFLDSLGISATADEAMVARVHQQATADSD
ncbi:hypothetical protein [Corynebacterium silvaticum]|uniref:Uncharacterized protein n=1 Tax=Corynebacterium silvaticum TaxID=2320431 RepID=A0A7Y4P9X3_9CORY|nr:hypothetical protein [Corynebacterium silvaticum]MBH5301070.1 hypothetical protein [Corynebacterium silvaticum]NON70907.1 hypothetical protein [Corynebacterium silvaticum]TFA92720.1 hypothetical protein EU802_05055 [Corynebacterium silvaticum]TFA96404.1 hypothetical protein EU799_05235 [Corynebacterium silvaticum]TNX84298.1 hypothetical protein FIT55_07130 [Corynebacterium silvaticum]